MYERCQGCKGWVSLNKPYYTAHVDGKLVYLHDMACVRILKYRVPVTKVRRENGHAH